MDVLPKNETEEKRVARYLVGPYNNSWNFMDAVEKRRMEIPSSLKMDMCFNGRQMR